MSEALIFIQAHTASTSAELDFTSCLSSTYDEYVIEFIQLVPDTSGGIKFSIQMHITGGSYDTGSNYDWVAEEVQATTPSDHGGSSDTVLTVCNAQESGTAVAFSGKIYLYNPQTTSFKKYIHGTGSGSHGTSGAVTCGWWVSGIWKSLSTADGFRVLPSSGNIASGVVRLYGVSPVTPLVPYGGAVINDNEEGGFIESGCPILI